MKRLIIGLVVAAVVGSAGHVEADSFLYSVTDLGDLPGGENSSEAFAINNSGQIVGMSGVANGSHAYLWQNGVMTDIGVPGDQHSSIAYDINDSGHVAGHSFGDSPYNRPFLYHDGSMIDLGDFGGGGANAGSVNNSNEVVGISVYANGVTHAIRWSNGTMLDLDPAPGGTSYAYGINDLGQIVGTKVPFGSQGFLWEDGALTDLGDLFGGSGHTTPFVINNASQVVGYSGLVGSSETHPFIWQDGVMTHLGSLSGATGAANYARGINNLGDVVGMSGGRAFIWDSVDGMRDLNELTDDSGDGWNFTHAYDINDGGQIVGFGYDTDGVHHALLLTPIPEPSTVTSLVGLGIMLSLTWVWRRRKQK